LGAWIEIILGIQSEICGSGRSRLGAWIEIGSAILRQITSAGRSRLGAWIEISYRTSDNRIDLVAPAWERGLK